MVKVTEAMAVVAKLAEALGVTSINQLEGCWEHRIDEVWWFACNGHAEPQECHPHTHPTAAKWPIVPPYGVYAERSGWPALMVDITGGCTIGAGNEEDAFIAAVREKTELVAGQIPFPATPNPSPSDYAICTGPPDPPMEFRRIEPRQFNIDDALKASRESQRPAE